MILNLFVEDSEKVKKTEGLDRETIIGNDYISPSYCWYCWITNWG